MYDVFNSIKQDLNEAVAFSNGKCPKAAVHEFSPADVKNIRSEIGMSQTEFSSAFGISSVVGWVGTKWKNPPFFNGGFRYRSTHPTLYVLFWFYISQLKAYWIR